MKILVGTDGSEHGDLAVKKAIELAAAMDATVTVVSVVQNLPMYGAANFHHPLYDAELYGALTRDLERVASEVLSRADKLLEDSGVNGDTQIRAGNPGEELLRLSKQGEYDLIVVGHRGLGALSGLLLGSVSSRVVQNAGTSVLVVK